MVVQKLSVPNLEQIYIANTGHTAPITNFGFTSTAVFTTSLDSSLRGFEIESGEPFITPVEDLECDHLESEGDFVLTRCGGGAAFLVWKQVNMNNEL